MSMDLKSLRRLRSLVGSRFLCWMLLSTFLTCVLLSAAYFLAPSATTNGSNHGSWRYEAGGVLLWLPFYLILPTTFFGGLALALWNRSFRLLLSTIVVSTLEIACAVAVMVSMFHMID